MFKIYAFSVSISGHLISLRNCHAMCKLSPVLAQPGLNANGPVVWGVAVCVRVGMRFCKVPVSGQDFRVTIKLSRWLSPDKWYGVVTSR